MIDWFPILGNHEYRGNTQAVLDYTNAVSYTHLTFSVVTDLKALVFEPELYYQGIEAIAVKSFVYKALTAKDVNADADNRCV